MITNCSITIYNRIREKSGDHFERVFVPAAWHHSGIKFTPGTEGMKAGTNVTNVHTVRIPDLSVAVSVGDFIVLGEDVPEEIHTAKDLQGYDYFVVSGVNYNRTGLNQHIKVVGI